MSASERTSENDQLLVDFQCGLVWVPSTLHGAAAYAVGDTVWAVNAPLRAGVCANGPPLVPPSANHIVGMSTTL